MCGASRFEEPGRISEAKGKSNGPGVGDANKMLQLCSSLRCSKGLVSLGVFVVVGSHTSPRELAAGNQYSCI